MSTIAVAKKDFNDGVRSRTLIGLVVLFAVFLAGVTYYFTEIIPATGTDVQMVQVMPSILLPTYTLLPIVGVLVGYKAIVGERESGSLKFLLALPHSRRDVVVGKLLGRSGIITGAVFVGYAVGGVVLYAFTDSFVVVDFLLYTLVTVLLGVTFVSIAIAFSSVTPSSSIATAGAVTLVLLFLFLWDLFLSLVTYAGTELSLIASTASPPDWYLFLRTLNPTTAYSGVLNWLLASNAPAQSGPFYLQNWFGFVILAFWLVVPIGVALVRFQRADL